MEENKPKRGRPKKQVPTVNEDGGESKTLLMTQNTDEEKARETIRQTAVNLTKLFSQKTSGAISNAINLNAFNPFLQNERLKKINTRPAALNRDDLIKALTSPQDNEQGLRAEAWSMSSSQYLYYKILRLACDVPLYKWYVTPEYLEDDEYSSDKFKDENIFVEDWLTTLDIKNTFKRIALEVKREGKATYVLRNSIGTSGGKKVTNYACLQKLPSDYVKLVRIGTHGYVASFNMMIFLEPAFSPDQFPPFIADAWKNMENTGAVKRYKDKNGAWKHGVDLNIINKYKFEYTGQSGTSEELIGTFEMSSTDAGESAYFYWLQLPQEECYTFCSDSSNPWALPDTVGMLLSLDELSDYDTLQGLIESSPLSAILVAEADMIKDPNAGKDQTALNPETIYGLQGQFNRSTSTNLEAFFAPLKNFKLLSLPAQPNGNEISMGATRNVINRAGLGAIISTTDKPQVSQVKTAQALMEAEVAFVTNQFESVLNLIVNNLIGCDYKWKVHLWGGIFSFADEVKRDKEMFVSGAAFVLPKLASAYDMTIRDVGATQKYIDSLKIYDGFKTITQVNQERMMEESSDDEGDEGPGRPEVDESEIENENTEKSKNSGLDTADVRDFA